MLVSITPVLREWTFDRKRISANLNPNSHTIFLTLKHKSLFRKRNDVIFRASIQIPYIRISVKLINPEHCIL